MSATLESVAAVTTSAMDATTRSAMDGTRNTTTPATETGFNVDETNNTQSRVPTALNAFRMRATSATESTMMNKQTRQPLPRTDKMKPNGPNSDINDSIQQNGSDGSKDDIPIANDDIPVPNDDIPIANNDIPTTSSINSSSRTCDEPRSASRLVIGDPEDDSSDEERGDELSVSDVPGSESDNEVEEVDETSSGPHNNISDDTKPNGSDADITDSTKKRNGSHNITPNDKRQRSVEDKNESGTGDKSSGNDDSTFDPSKSSGNCDATVDINNDNDDTTVYINNGHNNGDEPTTTMTPNATLRFTTPSKVDGSDANVMDRTKKLNGPHNISSHHEQQRSLMKGCNDMTELSTLRSRKRAKRWECSDLDYYLSSLKYANADRRIQLARQQDVLSQSIQQLNSICRHADKSADTLKGFNGRLDKALSSSRILHGLCRKVDSEIIVLRNKMTIILHLKKQVADRMNETRKRYDDVKNRDQSLWKTIHVEKTKTATLIARTTSI